MVLMRSRKSIRVPKAKHRIWYKNSRYLEFDHLMDGSGVFITQCCADGLPLKIPLTWISAGY